jgi:hypothetical protein
MAAKQIYSTSYIHGQRPQKYRPESSEHLQIDKIFEEMQNKSFAQNPKSSLPPDPVQNLLNQGHMVKEIELFVNEHFSQLTDEIEKEYYIQKGRDVSNPDWTIYRDVTKSLITIEQLDIKMSKQTIIEIRRPLAWRRRP